MNINTSILVQIISLLLFIWLTKALILPPLQNILQQRAQKIQEGLNAAELSRVELAQAQEQKAQILNEAKERAQQIIARAKALAKSLSAQAASLAIKEREALLAKGREKLEQDQNNAKNALYQQTVKLAIQMAEKILVRSINEQDQQRLVQNLVQDIVER